MREIKVLGTYRKEGLSSSCQYSLFECPTCGDLVEKIRRDGLNAKSCSHQCYSKNRTGTKRGAYKEKVFLSGYFYIYKPDHPKAIRGFYVAEHRLVVEEKLCRYLEDCEVVHHINRNKLDNHPENLQVMTASEHIKLHTTTKRRKKNGKFAV